MYNPYVGILKFLLSILVVAIHVHPFDGDFAFYLNNCIARLAVPIFFILSSYYLFDKLLNNNWDKQIFWKQQKHLAKYYLAWLVVNLPFILNLLLKGSSSALEFSWKLIQGIFLKGPYGALWFLPASLLALTLVYLIGRKCSPKLCLALSFPFFLFATIQVEYNAFVKDISWINAINHYFTSIFGWLANGLNVGFFFCSIGLYIAATKNKPRNIQHDIIKATLSICMLLLETSIIRNYGLGVDYWAMFFIIPSAYYIAQFTLHMKAYANEKTIKPAKILQLLSLMIYPMHYAVMDILKTTFANFDFYTNSKTIPFVAVLAVTLAISCILLFLGEKKNLKIAKALYGK